jgi:adenosylhomocysteinase
MLEGVPDETTAESREWAVSAVRRFASTTNLLLAGRTFSIYGSGPRARALASLLTGIGSRHSDENEAPDYLFCSGETSRAIALGELGNRGGRGSESRPTIVIDSSPTGQAIDHDSFGALTELRAGVFATASSQVFIVRPRAGHDDGSPEAARGRIDWARRFMPVTAALAREIADDGLVDGVRVGLSMVLEPKTAVLALVLRGAGADVTVFAHPDETDDAVAAVLREEGIPVYAQSGAASIEHHRLALAFLDARPELLIDDGSHLIRLAHAERPHIIESLIGAAEETTSGLRPLRRMAEAGLLRVPVIAVNDARSKTLFDNRFGTGQSCVFAILDLLSLDPTGLTVVVAGYGHVGEGVVHHARALGANVVVAEVDPVRALQATFAGLSVAPLLEAVRTADIVISATGVTDTISIEVLLACAENAVVAIAGGVPQEVAIDDAVAAGASRETVGQRVERFTLPGGSSVLVLDDGGCINITAGEGNPIEIMDLSFAVQVSAIRYLLTRPGPLLPGVYALPADADDAVAALALRSSGRAIDSMAGRVGGSEAAESFDWRSSRFVRAGFDEK